MSNLNRLPRRAFTLVELLVVIGIIAVLISILLPSLNAARRSASNVKCQNNLKQIGMAIVMYADSNDGNIPWQVWADWTTTNYPAGSQSTHWYKLITPFLSSGKGRDGRTLDPYTMFSSDVAPVIAACPEWDGAARWNTSASSVASKPGYGYNALPKLRAIDSQGVGTAVSGFQWGPFPADNIPVGEVDKTGPIKLTDLRPASDRILMGDSVDYHLHLSFNSTEGRWNWPRNSTVTSLNYRFTSGHPDRHGKPGARFQDATANYVFADTHVESLTPDQARRALLQLPR